MARLVGVGVGLRSPSHLLRGVPTHRNRPVLVPHFWVIGWEQLAGSMA